MRGEAVVRVYRKITCLAVIKLSCGCGYPCIKWRGYHGKLARTCNRAPNFQALYAELIENHDALKSGKVRDALSGSPYRESLPPQELGLEASGRYTSAPLQGANLFLEALLRQLKCLPSAMPEGLETLCHRLIDITNAYDFVMRDQQRQFSESRKTKKVKTIAWDLWREAHVDPIMQSSPGLKDIATFEQQVQAAIEGIGDASADTISAYKAALLGGMLKVTAHWRETFGLESQRVKQSSRNGGRV